MKARMRIAAITPIFPSPQEPYRGAAIWNTLGALTAWADVRAYCTLPRYLFKLWRLSTRYHEQPADTSAYQVPCETVQYSAIPVFSRSFNGEVLTRVLRTAMAASLRPDVILCYWVYPEGFAAVRLATSLGVPAVVGSRGSDLRLVEPNPMIRYKVHRTMSEASAVLCVSSDLANWAEKYGARGNVHTIRNGIDASVFRFRPQSSARQGLGVPADERVVLFVGWLSAQKGVPQFLDAIAILNQRDGGGWHAALIGEGYMEADLRRQAQDLHIAENIRFLGPQLPQQIATWMAAADLLCLPSETEGCPNVILEALSCGCPVVATSVGGIPELVDQDCAVLIPERRPDVLARALGEAAQRTWDRGQIAGKHQRSWQQVARETYAVCEQAVAARLNVETGIEVGHGA